MKSYISRFLKGAAVACLLGTLSSITAVAEEPPKTADAVEKAALSEDQGSKTTEASAVEKVAEAVSDVDERIRTAIQAGAETYCKAFCDHDASAAAMHFTENAEFVQANGETLRGRKEIEESLSSCFESGDHCRLELSIDSIQFPAPNVAIEDGTSWTIHGDEEQPISYTAVHVKDGDQWKIASIRERVSGAARPHRQKIRELDWLHGDWIDQSSDAVVLFSCRPVDNGNFLTRDFAVKIGDEEAIRGTQRIGWDPVLKSFRVWYFDSEGGFGEGTLAERDEDEWVMKLSGVTSDGEIAGGTFQYSVAGPHVTKWRVIEQMIGTELSTDETEVTLVRQSPAPRASDTAQARSPEKQHEHEKPDEADSEKKTEVKKD
jgi:uncharacterized protein (TIGR02246 family)